MSNFYIWIYWEQKFSSSGPGPRSGPLAHCNKAMNPLGWLKMDPGKCAVNGEWAPTWAYLIISIYLFTMLYFKNLSAPLHTKCQNFFQKFEGCKRISVSDSSWWIFINFIKVEVGISNWIFVSSFLALLRFFLYQKWTRYKWSIYAILTAKKHLMKFRQFRSL